MRFILLCLGAMATVGLAGAASTPKVQATIYAANNCIPCRLYIAAVRREMPPDGWIVRDAGDRDVGIAHVVIADAAGLRQALPLTVILRDGKEVERLSGRITPTELAGAINRHLK
jgi:hypothetical protein